MLANATSETGIVNNLFVGADIKIAPVAKCLGKFLNEESDAAPSDADIVATTSKLFVIPWPSDYFQDKINMNFQ